MSLANTIDEPLRRPSVIPNGWLGMMLLIGTETILFSSFIGAYLVLRMGAPMWPPFGTPALRIGLSAWNSGVLVMSSALAVGFVRAVRQEQRFTGRILLGATLFLGTLFLVLQGVEFHRLYAQGLTLQSGPYGAVFYCLISLHGLHVIGGLGFLAYLLWQMQSATTEAAKVHVIQRAGYAGLYWHFVTAVWLVLFTILYIL